MTNYGEESIEYIITVIGRLSDKCDSDLCDRAETGDEKSDAMWGVKVPSPLRKVLLHEVDVHPIHAQYFLTPRDLRTGEIWWNLGIFVLARAAKRNKSWSRFSW